MRESFVPAQAYGGPALTALERELTAIRADLQAALTLIPGLGTADLAAVLAAPEGTWAAVIARINAERVDARRQMREWRWEFSHHRTRPTAEFWTRDPNGARYRWRAMAMAVGVTAAERVSMYERWSRALESAGVMTEITEEEYWAGHA